MYSNTSKEDVSIIVPIHNEEETLNRSLRSIRRQKAKEIIVVLDRCEDNSENIACEHGSKDSRIRVFSLDKHKFKINYIAETVNFGIAKAKCGVICSGEADTVFGTDYISSLLPHLKEPVASVSGRMVPIHRKSMYFRETITGTGRIFFRKVWEELGGFQDILSCDTFFDLELLKRGWEVKVIEEAVLYDIRNYTMKQLALRAVKRGKGRRQLGQSLPFMLGHGLFALSKSPFGLVELVANTAGYITTSRRVEGEIMKFYEAKRFKRLAQRLIKQH